MKVQNRNCEVMTAGNDDNHPGLSFELIQSSEHSIFTRHDTLVNEGNEELVITRCLSGFEMCGRIQGLMYQESSWCDENRPVYADFLKGIHLESNGARTTGEYNPFIRIYFENGIVTFHVHPVGDWELNIYPSDDEDDRVIVTAGLKSDGLYLKLPPGEKMKLPCITVHEHPSTDQGACNLEFQKFLNDDIHLGNRTGIPVIYNSWFYDFDKFLVDDLERQAAVAKELGAEIFVVDAGWYGPSHDDWSKAAGDWREKTDGAFFGDMKGFSKYVKSLGMGFGLWIEPEKVCSGMPVLKEHPDWFIKADQGIYYPDLARIKPGKYIEDVISSLIKTYSVAWLKLDFNFPLANDPYKSNHHLYMKGYYKMIDSLRSSHPGVIFEACQSGAMRADLESIRHFDTQFLSDTVYPRDIVRIFKNALYRTSPSLLFKWVVLRQIWGIPRYGIPLDESPASIIVPMGPTWNEFTGCDMMTLCCLFYLGSTGLSGDLDSLDENNRKILKEHISNYKKYIQGTKMTILPVDTNEPGWTIFRVENEKASIKVSFRERGSSPVCMDAKMPDSIFASVDMEVKNN